MPTKNTSIRRLPKLERLLLDGDIDPELADYLKAVGFDVQLAPRNDPVIRNDVQVLRYARKRGRIVVCHDKHRGIESELELFPEIYHRGGRILRITDDSSQSLISALGKIAVHYTEWSEWFKANSQGGRVVVSKQKCVKTTADEFMQRHLHRVYRTPETLPLPPRRKNYRRRRKSPTPPGQTRLHA